MVILKYLRIIKGKGCFYRQCSVQAMRELTGVVIRKGLNPSVIRLHGMLPQLASVKIPESVKYIGEGAFSYCYHLKDIKLPSELKTLQGILFHTVLGLMPI